MCYPALVAHDLMNPEAGSRVAGRGAGVAMASSSAAWVPVPPVVVHLLDPQFGRPVKSWKFTDREMLTIGRNDDRDIEISDPYVSRNHAELHYFGDHWLLVSHGRNGVVVNNQVVKEATVHGTVTFRLGANGPTLKFDATPARNDNPPTLCYDTALVSPVALFQVDQAKVQKEVEGIAEGNYFQELQRRARELRRRAH